MAKNRKPEQTPPDDPKGKRKSGGMRETVESIVVAFVLAFLFRTFEAEAFVIPTGSMAPTLMGRHKEVDCPKCRYHFPVGASEELNQTTGRHEHRIKTAVCPNCRYEIPTEKFTNLPPFKGDRILVVKYPYEFADPNRWDVVVFKYPEDPDTNYIKRLVGLPGETLEVRQGDVYSHAEDGVKILRKDDPDKQQRLQILVYDDAYPPRELLDRGWPERWASGRIEVDEDSEVVWRDDAAGWKIDADDRRYTVAADAKLHWLRYRHYTPGYTFRGKNAYGVYNAWKAAAESKGAALKPRLQLITDFCGYNATTGGDPQRPPFDGGLYWVGDLTLSCQVSLDSIEDGSELIFELNEGFRWYRVRINPATGEAVLAHSDGLSLEGEEVAMARADTDLQGAGKYAVSFANVDDRLCLWIDGDRVDFGAGKDGRDAAEYAPFGGMLWQKPTIGDLAPAGIAAKNCKVTVSKLLLERDIYYRAERLANDLHSPHNLSPVISEFRGNEKELKSTAHNPEEWFATYYGSTDANQTGYVSRVIFPPLNDDQYFMMGDNSPASQDSRIWPNSRRQSPNHRHAVPRSLLVGKAFYIYWPHGVPFFNEGRGYSGFARYIPLLNKWFYHRTPSGELSDYPANSVPFYPNVHRMQRIR